MYMPEQVSADWKDLNDKEREVYRRGYQAGHSEGRAMGLMEQKLHGLAYELIGQVILSEDFPMLIDSEEARSIARDVSIKNHTQRSVERILDRSPEMTRLVEQLRGELLENLQGKYGMEETTQKAA